MGCCSSSLPSGDGYAPPPQQQQAGDGESRLPLGGNKPLKPVRPVWTAEAQMTMSQLKRKRDEFWETAHNYEGQREIWDALKAACETDDVKLAQAIVDSANIFLPTGVLTDAYDERGRKYTIPLYCISDPTNLINDDGTSRSAVSLDAKGAASGSGSGGSGAGAAGPGRTADRNRGKELPVVLRLSTPKDLKVTLYEQDSIRDVKELVLQTEKIPIEKQRIFLTGHLLDDKTRLRTLKLGEHPVLQVMCMI